jgi:hypothetical protein
MTAESVQIPISLDVALEHEHGVQAVRMEVDQLSVEATAVHEPADQNRPGWARKRYVCPRCGTTVIVTTTVLVDLPQ